MCRLCMALFAYALVLTAASSSVASLLHVPTDFGTIQAALDAASSSDTVVVAPGTYFENVRVEAKSVRLVSQFALDGNIEHILETILDGSQPLNADSASIIRLVDAGNSLVQGFTMTRGAGTIWRDQTDMHLYREGGAILVEGGSPSIRNNLFLFNQATDTTGVESAGGGAIRGGYGSVEVQNNAFAFNSAHYGGGVMLFKTVGVIKNNIFYRNFGGEYFGGGGFYSLLSPSTQTIQNNTFIENRSAIDGGGILLWFNAANMENNILWGNVGTSASQISLRQGATSSTVFYSDVEGGFVGTGNIDDPPLVSPVTFYLDLLSPCVDAGNPNPSKHDLPDSPDTTLALPPARGLRHNDMGAFGGPGMHDFPAFNAPGLALHVSSIDFGSVIPLQSGMQLLPFSKATRGFVMIDSALAAGGVPLGMLGVQSPIPAWLGPSLADSLDTLQVMWTPDDYGTMQDTLFVYHTDPSVATPLMVLLTGFAPGTTGDANFDGVMTAADIIYLVGFTFKGGPAPLPVPRSGDVNCDGNVTASDIIFMVNFVFKSGPPPCL